MITLENEMLEKIYYEEFKGDARAFGEYLQGLVSANNVEYEEDLSYLEEILNDPESNISSGYTLQEVFAMLEKKYYAN